jgi:glycosyltransferase involved in cell wall biosynthesis
MLDNAELSRDRVEQNRRSSSWRRRLRRLVRFPAKDDLAPQVDTEAAWYLANNPEIVAAGIDARDHYRDFGTAEGRQWGLPAKDEVAQQANWYLLQNPDVAAAGVDALTHFLEHGANEGRSWPRTQPTADELAAAGLPWVKLLNIVVDRGYANHPALNVLVPTLAIRGMSGGPNTAVNIACRLAAAGIKIRLVSVSAPLDPDHIPFWSHAANLVGFDPRDYKVELIDASYRAKPFVIGENDLFMATAWWTAQAAKYAVRHVTQRRFLYLIQDYECLLHPASTEQALASETYNLNYLPIVNTSLLYDFFVENRIGCFSNREFAAQAFVFEPAIDTKLFFPPKDGLTSVRDRKKRLLFYARPANGARNLFELGVAALRKLVSEGKMSGGDWEFCGMGDPFDPVPLGAGSRLEALPWKGLMDYAQQMRASEVLLSLMLSPHPSYPPMEMAACGRPVVTTTYSTKNKARLQAISRNIYAVEPTVEGIAEGLLSAISHGGRPEPINMPTSWSESLDSMVSRLYNATIRLLDSPSTVSKHQSDPGRPLFPGFSAWPRDSYGVYRQRMLADRADCYTESDPKLVSLITTVWDTPPNYLRELAQTVFAQDSGHGFEWVVLDNGSSRRETRAELARIAENPAVRMFRVEENIGIIHGLRYVLERARHRYVLPLDSDDLLTPDCLRIMTTALRRTGLPLLAYSDEEKVLSGHARDPYCKPDFDVVLFTHSCYTAHLCAIDREAALELGCYTASSAEGSSDWDSFTRFLLAGHTPLHVPEMLYTWRMHPQSTSLDIDSKAYIHESQLSVLRMFLSGRTAGDGYKVELSPLFSGTPDWRFVRNPDAPRAMTTLIYGSKAEAHSLTPQFNGHRIERFQTMDLAVLLDSARRATAEGHYLHLLSAAVEIDDKSWIDEALAMFELYPGTAIVGGRIHDNGIVVAADSYFGFDGVCNSPNLGRSLLDPGYFAQMLKPHTASAVATQHCVVDPNFLLEALPPLMRAEIGLSNLSAWLGAAARTRNLRCIYSPFLSGALNHPSESPAIVEVAAFAIAFRDLIPERQLLSPRLGLTRPDAYKPIQRDRRSEEESQSRTGLSLPYPDQHRAEYIARRIFTPPSDSVTHLSVLTSVYIRTDPLYFRAAADSLLTQTLPFTEWVILAHGPITPALEASLAEIAHDKRIRVLRRATNLGIIGGMRVCLESATGRFVVPMDADDVLTPDALQLLVEALTREGGADFAYSDEDILHEDKLQSPIRRTSFDPILNDADSTIWHLCGFDRNSALRLGVYSDPGADACHDWDTVQRFGSTTAVVRHVPQVLYHWRHHISSTSASGSASDASLRSVHHVLSGIMSRQAAPELYEIRPYPLSRGIKQLALLRRHVKPAPICLIYLTREARITLPPDDVLATLPIHESRVVVRASDSGAVSDEALARALTDVESEIVVVLDDALRPSNDEGPWDAMRLFEMHADVAAVGGRILDAQSRVVACSEVLAGRDVTDNWIGKSSHDPGSFALALKPQSATTLADGYFFCRSSLFRSIMATTHGSMAQPQLGVRLAKAADLGGMKLAYSPLVEATIRESTDMKIQAILTRR